MKRSSSLTNSLTNSPRNSLTNSLTNSSLSPKRSQKSLKKSSPRSPKKISPKSLRKSIGDLPCDVILKIIRTLNPNDYMALSAVSKQINDCLTYGGYNMDSEKKRLLKEAQKDLRSILKNKLKGDLEMIKQRPNRIAKLKKEYLEIPIEIQIAAVKSDPYGTHKALQYLTKDGYIPPLKVWLAAIKTNPDALKGVNPPPEDIQLSLVKRNGYVIKWFGNPANISNEVQLQAVKNNSIAFYWLVNSPFGKPYYIPPEEVQLQAVSEDPENLMILMDNNIRPSNSVWKMVVESSDVNTKTIFDLLQYKGRLIPEYAIFLARKLYPHLFKA